MIYNYDILTNIIDLKFLNRMLKPILRKIGRTLYKLSLVINYLKPDEFKYYVNKKNFILEKLTSDMHQEVFDCFGENLKQCLRFNTREEIRKFSVDLALENEKKSIDNKNPYYLEFGVFNGTSTNFISKNVEKLYAFDSFEGISEEWLGVHPKGHYTRNKKIPYLRKNIVPVVGLVEDTLDDFLNKHNPKIYFVHMDLDVYGPTEFTLRKLKSYLAKGSIILFDELYNYINWKEGEYKALKEVFDDKEYRYRAFNLQNCQVAIEIL